MFPYEKYVFPAGKIAATLILTLPFSFESNDLMSTSSLLLISISLSILIGFLSEPKGVECFGPQPILF